jgi:hypothetical protein
MVSEKNEGLPVLAVGLVSVFSLNNDFYLKKLYMSKQNSRKPKLTTQTSSTSKSW